MCSPTRPNANKPTNYQQRTDPRSCVRVVYIAGDTLRHQPMGADHMTVLELRGPMVFCVLQWCYPMPASIKEDKLLYPDDHLIWCSKVDSGPRTFHIQYEELYSFNRGEFLTMVVYLTIVCFCSICSLIILGPFL